MIFQVLSTLLAVFYFNPLRGNSNRNIQFSFGLILWLIAIFNPLPNNSIHYFFKVSASLFSVFFLLNHYQIFFLTFKYYRFLYLYSFFCIFSSIWSETPFLTLLNSSEYFLFISYFITWSIINNKKVIHVFAKLIAFMVFGGLFSYIFQHDLAFTLYNYDDRGLIGISSLSSVFPRVNPNSLSQASVLFLILILGNIIMISNKKIKSLLIIIALFVLFMSRSRTSLLFFVLYVVNKNFTFSRVLIFINVALVLVYGFWDDIIVYILRGQKLEEFLGGSGRLNMWEVGVNNFLESPFIGKGYKTKIQGINHLLNMEVSTYDNTFLDIIYYTGLIGFIPIFIFLIKVLKGILKMETHMKGTMLWLFGLILIRALSGPTFHILHVNSILLVLIYSISLKQNKSSFV